MHRDPGKSENVVGERVTEPVVGISRVNLNTVAPTAVQPSPPLGTIRAACIPTAMFADRHAEFDPRSMELALVDGDLVGNAFGVRAFHGCQMNDLLRGQMIPLDTESSPDGAIVTHNGPPAQDPMF